ncbi:M16 family metallopeptidase [Thalassotalea atypica]|uniref:M16 family metallopeptidase n=1 Tax=Thalassotalea atypica TaxID=2054316 RepID=UPI0025742140|nr:pitrilysin family protein [Thalassotalea atypica]
MFRTYIAHFKTGAVASAIVASASIYCLPSFAAEKITSVEGITEYRLDNGLQVLLFPDQTKETVTVNVTYRVGSKHENYGETGMAHLLEHLVFKGTPNHKDIPAELSSHGARPNGTTWTDRTNYFETFAATEENINWALDMESDRMVNSFIAKKDLDSEMTVVRNEFERGENSPFRVTMQRMMAAAYDWHNYGKSTIGARADLENVPIDRLQAFYKKYYQPDNATLIVAGKFENKDMIKLVDKYFAPIPKPTRVINPLYTAEPAQDGERQITVRRVGDVQLLGAMYHFPAGSHEEFSAVNVLTEIVGANATGRMHKSLVEPGLASRAFGFNFQWQEPGLGLFAAEIDKDADISKAEEAMLATLESISETPFTDEEVERAKRTLLKNIELSFNSSENIALGLSEWVGMGDWRLLFLDRDRIEKVTTADVQKVAEAYLVRNNRTLGKFIPTEKPERVEIPQVANVSDMVKGYKGREAVAQGEVFDPSQDNIDKRTKVVTLSNGTKVALLQKKTRGEAVVVRIATQMGTEKSLHGKALAGDLAGDMLMRGTQNLSREQLKDEFDKLKANVRIGGGAEGASARAETVKANLVDTLKLVGEVLKEPAFDEQEFTQLVSTQEVDIEQQLQDPQSIAFREYSRRQSQFPKGHPRHVSALEDVVAELKAITLKDVKAFHEEFYGANSMQISIVGDFDEQKVLETLELEFANWRSDQKYKRVEHTYNKLAVKDQDFNTPDKENAVFVAAVSLPVGINDKDAPALELGNYILGGGFLNSRLATRLRQKDGLSYGAGSFVNMSRSDDRASMGAYAICAPQNLNKVEIGFKEELTRLLKDGFTDEEISAAKSGLLQGKKVSRSQDNELVGKLNSNLYYDKNMQFSAQYEEALSSLTAKDVHKVMKKYLKVEDFSMIKAGDFSKVE